MQVEIYAKNTYIFLLTKETSILKSILNKINPNTDLNGPLGLQDVEAAAPRISKNQHIQVARLSALCTGRLYPSGDNPDAQSRLPNHIVAGRIKSMKNPSDSIRNRILYSKYRNIITHFYTC